MARRFLLIFIAVLLPLQLAWGSVSAYCGHENGAAAKHFGHHEHVHKAESKKAVDLKVAPDNDCGTCHAAGSIALLGTSDEAQVLGLRESVDDHAQRAPLFIPADKPERPRWPRLA